MNDMELATKQQGGSLSQAPFHSQPPPEAELLHLHRALRGRYRWAASAAALLALVGVVVGMRVGWRSYQSTGLIRVMPMVPKVMYTTDEKGVIPMFETFMDAQVSMIKSQRVIDIALQDPAWAALGRVKSDQVALRFAKNLDVTRQGEILVVRATDTDPQSAMTAVQSVMTAYQKIYEEREARSGEKVEGILHAARTNLQADVDSIRRRIMGLEEEYGPDGLKSQIEFKLLELNKIESDIGETQRRLAAAASTTRPAGMSGLAADDEGASTDDAIAMDDPKLVQYIAEFETARRRVLAMQAGDMLPQHPMLRQAEAELAAARDDLKRHAGLSHSLSGDSGVWRPGALNLLRTRLAAYERLRTRAKEELAAMSRQLSQITELDTHAKRSEDQLQETQRRIEELHVEGKISGRLELTSDADRPLESFRDTRMVFAGLGGGGGAMLGFSLVLVLGLLDRRLRYPLDATDASGSRPILGILPMLPDDLADPEQAAQAAHSVHEIRMLLQIRGAARGHRVYAITSPAARTGKTSLTLALGVSFAAAGLRTLLIDADLVGGGLTARADFLIRRKIGHILRRNGAITERQLEDALELARGSKRRLGEILIELGCLTEAEVVAAMRNQAEQPVGILDALAGETLENCVAPSGIERLSVLPLGGATRSHAGTLSPESVRKLIAAAREQFDAVLVDTGPAPGSLEASIIASQVDAVVLVASRGEHRQALQQLVTHLQSIDACVAGAVFNRAMPGQNASAANTASSPSGKRTDGEPVPPVAPPGTERFDPVARAVVSCAARSSVSDSQDQT